MQQDHLRQNCPHNDSNLCPPFYNYLEISLIRRRDDFLEEFHMSVVGASGREDSADRPGSLGILYGKASLGLITEEVTLLNRGHPYRRRRSGRPGGA